MQEVAERFGKYVEHGPECWVWRGGVGASGYGHFWVNGKTVLAHRFSYETTGRHIPDGLCLDHLCRNRSCVNPDHLEPVTLVENVMRGESVWAKNARKTHCVRGHLLAEPNIRTARVKGKPVRACKQCHREKEAARRAGKKGG